VLASCVQVTLDVNLERGPGASCRDIDFPSPSPGFGVIGGSHCLFKLDVKLSSIKDLTHLGDIVLQEVFVQMMCDLQLAKERECGDFVTIGDFGQLASKNS